MAKIFNLCKFHTATTGTGTLTAGAAVTGFLLPGAAGAVAGDIVSYAIRDGAASEAGYGLWNGTTLTRAVHTSTNSNAAISLSGTAIVMITPLAEDIASGGVISQPTSASMTQFGNTLSNTATLSDELHALKAISRSRNDFPDARIGIGQPLAHTTFDFKTYTKFYIEQWTEFSSCGVVVFNSSTDAYVNYMFQTNHFIDNIPPGSQFLEAIAGTAFSHDTGSGDTETVLPDYRTGVGFARSLCFCPEYWRITGDGTDLVFWISVDGDNWIPTHTTPFATSFSGGSPDYVGLMLWPYGHLRAPHQITSFTKNWELIQ